MMITTQDTQSMLPVRAGSARLPLPPYRSRSTVRAVRRGGARVP